MATEYSEGAHESVKEQGPKPLVRTSSAESPAPGKVSATAGLASKGVAPRGVSPVRVGPAAHPAPNLEITEPAGYVLPKGTAPRAPLPSLSSTTERHPGAPGLTDADVHAVAQAVARELIKPLEVQLRSLEARLARAELTLDRTERTLESADASGGLPAVTPAARTAAPAPAVPSPLLAAPIPTPVTKSSPAPASPAPTYALPAPAVVTKAAEPRWTTKALAAPEVQLSSDELGMFDSGKRMRRIATVMVMVVLLAAGLLVGAMVVSRS